MKILLPNICHMAIFDSFAPLLKHTAKLHLLILAAQHKSCPQSKGRDVNLPLIFRTFALSPAEIETRLSVRRE